MAVVDKPQEELEEPDLRDYWRVVRERKWLVLLTVGVVLAASLAVSLLTTPRYEATATIVRENATLAETFFGAQSPSAGDPQRALQTAAGSVFVAQVADRAKAKLGSPLSIDRSHRDGNGGAEADSNMLLISAESEDPKEAAAVANAFAQSFVDVEFEKKKASIALARTVVESQLESMTPAELQSTRGATLADRAETLGIIERLAASDYALSLPAERPESPFEPRPLRYALFAIALGLALGIGLAFLFDYLDRRLKTEEAVEREFGLPVLASVPAVGKSWGRRRGRDSLGPVGFGDADPMFIESYRTLRSNLKFFEVNAPLRSILVTSALPKEGKTTTTINLAVSLALAGSRVIILETDLRRPMVHTYLGLTNEVGLSTFLAGACAFGEALQLVKVETLAPPESQRARRDSERNQWLQRNIYCMTSGPVPPNPAELIGSARMAELMAAAAENADYVLVDSPPLLSVADGMLVAPLVDGVLLAARMFHTTVDEARKVRTLLSRAGQEVKPIGVAVGGVSLGRRYYYRYGYYGGGAKGDVKPSARTKPYMAEDWSIAPTDGSSRARATQAGAPERR